MDLLSSIDLLTTLLSSEAHLKQLVWKNIFEFVHIVQLLVEGYSYTTQLDQTIPD